MANDESRLAPAPVGSKDAYHLQISDGGVVLPSNFGDMVEFAKMMSKADIAIPKHLRNNPGACLAVAMRARAWTMDPFAIATKTYAVNDVLAYEAQLVVAVINKFAPIVGRLVPRYEGDGPALKCFIEPKTRDDGQVLPYESPEVKDIGVKNSPLWKNDVRQQLFYTSARAWARRYYPELLLGVYDVEEARTMKDITPAAPVQNFLNEDEDTREAATESAAQPEDGKAGEVAAGPSPSPADSHDPETGEVIEGPQLTATEVLERRGEVEEETITPEKMAENMVKAINGFTSKVHLEEWQNESNADINALPKPLYKVVKKALDDKHLDLLPL